MRKSIFSLALLLACGSIHAQDEAPTAVVKVENDYKPIVVQVNKRGFTPTMASDEEITPLELKFSKLASPFAGFTSERNIRELLRGQESSAPGYARVGYGTGGSADAKLAYRLKTGENGIMRMIAALDGFNANVRGQYRDWDSRMYRTLLDADYTHEFSGLTLNVTGTFKNRAFNYQSTGKEVNITDKQNSKDYIIAAKGTGKLAGPFSYSFNAGYTHSRRAYANGLDQHMAQNRISAGGTAAYEIYDNELRRVGTDVQLDLYTYNSFMRKGSFGYSNFLSADINPFIDFNFEGWKLVLGTNINLLTSGGPAIAIAPDIKVEGNINSNLSLYASITGGRTSNGFESLDAMSPYWSFEQNCAGCRQLKPTYKVVDFMAGSRVSLAPFSFDFYAGYAYTKDNLLQTIKYSTVYNYDALLYVDIAQQNTHDFYIGGRAGCDFLGWLKLAADVRYDHWNCDNGNLLVMNPQFYAALEAEAEPLDGLVINAGYSLTRYTAGDTNGRLDNRYDLHARASYRINSMFGVFLQGEDLLNNKYYQYAGYFSRGIRGLAGVTVDF